ncbi:hypothetical protein [Weissella paramesenteroides]|uniref:hypothetical protein n=11 Tax=Weissella paramesenteroides TaxID=1249 RepID=UPI00123BD29A|nr:hypothetical protein [Weissella paramesenteroides]KAA8461662.1 hypothetical protein FKV83_10145 [Weissella paramesenteroides]
MNSNIKHRTTLAEDVETFITPLLSQDKIIRLTELKSITINDTLKEQLEQATPSMINDAGAKLVTIYGEKLISFLNVYLGTLGKKLDYRDGHIEQADNTAVQLLNELLKEALFAHLGLPRNRDGHQTPIDAGKAAIGLRSIMNVVTSATESAVDATSIRVYNDILHYYQSMQVTFGSFWLTLLTRILGIKATSQSESETLLALAKMADRCHFSKLNNAYTTLLTGDLNLSTFELEPFDASHMTSYQLNLAPNLDAQVIPPAWQMYLDGQWKNDEETVTFIREWLATHLLLQNPGKVLFIYSPGGSGKTLLLDAIRAMLSPQLTASVPTDQLDRQFGLEYLLQGDRQTVVRANLVDENAINKGIDWAKIKRLADINAVMNVDRKNTSSLLLPMNVQCTFAMNTLDVQINNVETTYAVQRKVCLLRFEKSFSKEEMDEDLGRRMIEELPQLGGLLIQTLREMKKRDDMTPRESVKMLADKKAWFASMTQDNSPVASFATERLQQKNDESVTRIELLDAFVDYCVKRDIPKNGFDSPRRFFPELRRVLKNNGIEVVENNSHTSPKFLNLIITGDTDDEAI